MEPFEFLAVAQQALWILALASAPILIPALLTGVLLGMVQAATSINEQTLTFVPKLLVALLVFGIAPRLLTNKIEPAVKGIVAMTKGQPVVANADVVQERTGAR